MFRKYIFFFKKSSRRWHFIRAIEIHSFLFCYLFGVLSRVELSPSSLGPHLPGMNQPGPEEVITRFSSPKTSKYQNHHNKFDVTQRQPKLSERKKITKIEISKIKYICTKFAHEIFWQCWSCPEFLFNPATGPQS